MSLRLKFHKIVRDTLVLHSLLRCVPTTRLLSAAPVAGTLVVTWSASPAQSASPMQGGAALPRYRAALLEARTLAGGEKTQPRGRESVSRTVTGGGG
eukprot:COSAG02_NODE_1749_length_11069_cov_88.967274_2_plen_97_part_00